MVVHDADLKYDPGETLRRLELVLAARATAACGSRFLGRVRGMTFGRWLRHKVLTLVEDAPYGPKLADMETRYKLMLAGAVKLLRLRAEESDFEPQVTAELRERRPHVLKLLIGYVLPTDKECKKASCKDGLPSLSALVKCRFGD